MDVPTNSVNLHQPGPIFVALQVARTLLLYLFSALYYYLPALVTKPIVSELFLYPDINLIERHLLLGGGHGQAY